MANKFKQQVTQQRATVPQVDPEGMRAPIPASMYAGEAANESHVVPDPAPIKKAKQSAQLVQTQPSASNMYHMTIVDSREAPVNRGFFMYPSRHRQVARDLAYIEDRKPWQIIEAALEEYVVKHYGKEYKRK
jgi:hypothetical protein